MQRSSTRAGRRVAPWLLGALVALALAPASASAGWLVFAKGGSIWVSRDDGSAATAVVSPSSVGEVRLSRPAVQPGGDAIAFESWNTDTTRVYAWEAGASKLVGGGSVNAVTASGSEDPTVTADRRVLYAFSNIAIVGGCGIFGCDINGAALGGFRWSALDTGATGDVHADCTDAKAPAADPANAGTVAYLGCTYTYDPDPDNGDPFDYITLHLLRVVGPSGDVWAGDDTEAQVDDPAWSPDGTRIVTSEQGGEAGLWSYPADGSGRTDAAQRRYVLQLPSGTEPFASPAYVGADRIAFVAQGDVWTIPATCDGCTFPGSATRVTSLGGITGVAWTSAASFRTTAPATGTSTPPATTTPTPVTPAPAVTPLKLSALRISPTAFRAARGTKITYTLTGAATVRFTVQRATTGRRVGGRCVKATRSNRSRSRCTRYVTLTGSFTHAGKQGANTLRFSGRLRGRKLAAGRYRLVATARDAAGRRTPEVAVTFRIR